MSQLTEVFTKKVGPLPAIAYPGIILGSYVLYKYTIGKDKSVPVAGDDTNTYATSGYNPFGMSESDASSGAGGGSTGGGSAPTTPGYVETPPEDNVGWARRAVNWLIAQSINPIEAQNSIASYINGTDTPLNSTQQAQVNLALSHFGTPPEGVHTVPVEPGTIPAVPVDQGEPPK